jgi:FkbH-like protein
LGESKLPLNLFNGTILSSMESIKLVVWDLDETFWKGTLSEEGAEPIQANIDLVKELTNRGIINSIASKNDFDLAKKKLLELGIWSYFVFPAIEWKPKGILIKQIIENLQLRDVNVLFLDDNHMNLNEAIFYSPNLHVKSEEFVDEILTHPAFQGKIDKDHTRLKQYKILEEKSISKFNFDSNIEFLKDSEIKLQLITDISDHAGRLQELIARSNQLNFTKIRIDDEALNNLIENPDLENVAIRVFDKYGDYGIVGFYSYDRQSHRLDHFVFSCRILNLGVPQFIFNKLGKPDLTIIPDVAESLDGPEPEWINETDFDGENLNSKTPSNTNFAKVVYKGGCEYDQLIFLLKNNNIDVTREVNYVTSDNVPVRQYHTESILDTVRLTAQQKKTITGNDLTIFTDEEYFDTTVFPANYDCLILNTKMDYTQIIYEHKTEKFKIPAGGFGDDYLNPLHHERMLKSLRERYVKGISSDYFHKFQENFQSLGRITTGQFINNLHELRNLIPVRIPIILINQPELESTKNQSPEVFDRYREMNGALEKFIDEAENCHLLDIRLFVNHESHLESDISHFKRKYYREISLELLKLLNSLVTKKINTDFSLRSLLIDRGLAIYEDVKIMKQNILGKNTKRKITELLNSF